MRQEEILQKLQKDLEMRGRSEETVREYVSKVRMYQEYYGVPAEELGIEAIQEYLHYLYVEKKLSASTVNTYNSAFRFVYGVTLDITMNYKKLARVKQTRRLPQIWTREEISRIIESAGSLSHKAMLMLAYGSGLRLSEIFNLKVSDIDSKQMRILVRQGKGGKDRYALLPETTLKTLREYWLSCKVKPRDWLFIDEKTSEKMRPSSVQGSIKTVVKRAGVSKNVSMHTLRHCFGTHMLNDGRNIIDIKNLMGHTRISTTALYLHSCDSELYRIKSPLDTLNEV